MRSHVKQFSFGSFLAAVGAFIDSLCRMVSPDFKGSAIAIYCNLKGAESRRTAQRCCLATLTRPSVPRLSVLRVISSCRASTLQRAGLSQAEDLSNVRKSAHSV
eukprot:s1217_g3.t1